MQGKDYYQIKEVAEMLDENPSTLRYWEAEFDELEPKRSTTGRRYYTAQDIETLRIIKFLLRTKGMHLNNAKLQLRKNRKNIGLRTAALEELTEVKTSLENLLKSLNLIKTAD